MTWPIDVDPRVHPTSAADADAGTGSVGLVRDNDYMRLAKAEFSGFGRLAEAQINLDHKVVAIVGPNEAGKTTLLRALAYIDNGESLTVAQRSRGVQGDVLDDHVVVRVQYRLSEEDKAALAEFDLDVLPTQLWLSRTAGEGETGRAAVPVPRKNRATLAVALTALTVALTDSVSGDLDVAEIDGDHEEDGADERRLSLRSRLLAALAAVAEVESPDIEARLRELSPVTWLAEFDEFGLKGPVRDGLEQVQAWMDRPDPSDEVAKALYDRSPDILMFSEEDRLLASAYGLTAESVANPPAALRNIAAMAELSLDALWATLTNGDEGARETLIELANQTLQTKFSEVWNQSNISAHLKINGTSLEIRVKQDGRTITQFHERSAGVQMFVALVAFLTVMDQGFPPILLIDEAEPHLHIDAQADLVNEFMTQTRAAKIIYTTHSPACLPPDLGTNIRAVVPDPENGQRSLVEGSFWTKGVGYSPLMLAMGAGAAAFSAARKVVLAEGATEMLLLPSLVKKAVGLDDLDYQVAPGLSEVPVTMYPELDLVGARVAFLVDGDAGGAGLRKSLLDAGVPESRIVTLGALTLEHLIDADAMKTVVAKFINEGTGAADVTPADVPDLPDEPTVSWSRTIQDWSAANGYTLPGKRVIASRLVEEGLAIPSSDGIAVLKAAHDALTAVLEATQS